jgi:hypothetical protein
MSPYLSKLCQSATPSFHWWHVVILHSAKHAKLGLLWLYQSDMVFEVIGLGELERVWCQEELGSSLLADCVSIGISHILGHTGYSKKILNEAAIIGCCEKRQAGTFFFRSD